MSGPPDRRPPGDRPHLLVDDVEAPALDDAALHHWQRVRRLREGADVSITDGAGRWRLARFGAEGALTVSGDVVEVPASAPVTVAFALTKGSKPELVVQKLTEVGVDRIVPIAAGHSIVRWDDAKAERQLARWNSIVDGAVEQSCRVHRPIVDRIGTVDDAVGYGLRRLDRGGAPLGPDVHGVAVGPEGGWTDDERDTLGPPLAISPHVLRAETAAITAGALLCSLRHVDT